MTLLTPPQRRALRAKAHHLQPVVTIGQHGITPGVLHEIDVNLRAHESDARRDERPKALAACAADRYADDEVAHDVVVRRMVEHERIRKHG